MSCGDPCALQARGNSTARDARCSVKLEWASAPPRCKLTRESLVGGQAPSGRQPVTRCSAARSPARASPACEKHGEREVFGRLRVCPAFAWLQISASGVSSRAHSSVEAAEWSAGVVQCGEAAADETASRSDRKTEVFRIAKGLRAPRRWKVSRIAEACAVSRGACGSDLDWLLRPVFRAERRRATGDEGSEVRVRHPDPEENTGRRGEAQRAEVGLGP